MREVIDIELDLKDGRVRWRRIYKDGARDFDWQSSLVEERDLASRKALIRALRKKYGLPIEEEVA